MPYYQVKDGIYVADGIAMSCSNTEKEQPSLTLFYDAIEDDIYKGLNLEMQRFADLKYLCNQGVMLLNTALTTEMNKPGSHKELWKPFMVYLLEEIFSKKENGIIFILAGKQSQYYAKYINPLQHYIIEVEHPAAASHKMRKWQHEKIFSKINYILKTNGKSEVDWVYEKPPF